MNYEEIPTNKGGTFLNVNNFKFVFKSRYKNKEFYKCDSDKCKIIITKDIETGLISHDYECESDSEYPLHKHSNHLKLIVNSKIMGIAKRELFRNPSSDLRSIYSVASSGFSEHGPLIKEFKNIQSTLQKFKSSLLPKQPANRAGLQEIDSKYTVTNDNNPFLLSNDGHDDKIIIYCTTDFLNQMCNSNLLLMDGTFKKCPSIFTQIYTIHFLLGKKVVPAAYCFLPDKSKATYTRMFNEFIRTSNLLSNTPFNPTSISCDFEIGLIHSVNDLFPNCEIRGCLFHLNQSFFRKIQSLGLSTLYFNDDEFSRSIRRVNALPLLPLHLIDNTFQQLSEEIRTEFSTSPNFDLIDQLLNYYYETYIKDDSLFPKEQWNQYRQLKRTNNDVEGFHNKFDLLFNEDHPQFYEVIGKIKSIQEENERAVKQLKDRGYFEPKKVDRYSKLNDNLNQLWDELDNDETTPLNFLSAAQYLLSNKKP